MNTVVYQWTTVSHICIKKFCNFLETVKLYSTWAKHQLLQYDVNTEPYFICCPKLFYIDIHLETAQFSHARALGIHRNMMLRFMTQALQDSLLCSSTDDIVERRQHTLYKMTVSKPALRIRIYYMWNRIRIQLFQKVLDPDTNPEVQNGQFSKKNIQNIWFLYQFKLFLQGVTRVLLMRKKS